MFQVLRSLWQAAVSLPLFHYMVGVTFITTKISRYAIVKFNYGAALHFEPTTLASRAVDSVVYHLRVFVAFRLLCTLE